MGAEMSTAGRAARLLLVDDHDLYRSSLRDMLADEPSVEVVGEAPGGREAVALTARVRPDLVLMDIRMPEMDGLEATREIKRKNPGISVLMVTMQEDPDYLFEALKVGAAGYVLKDATQEEMISAVLGVVSGDSPLDPDLAGQLLRRLVDDVQQRPAPPEREERPRDRLVQSLTARELEVLGFVARGYTNRQIANELVISVGTVKNHVEHIIAKLGVSDRTQAAVQAYEMRIIRPPES